jgi:hypothetical protein
MKCWHNLTRLILKRGTLLATFERVQSCARGAGPGRGTGRNRAHTASPDPDHDGSNAGGKSLEELRIERDILRYKAFERDPEFFKVYEMKALEVQRMELEIKARKGELDLLLAMLKRAFMLALAIELRGEGLRGLVRVSGLNCLFVFLF